MRGNQGIDDFVDIAAREVMGFQLIDLHVKPCLVRLDERQNDFCRRHAAHAHADERDDADVDIGSQRRNPKSQRHKMKENHDGRHNEYKNECGCD